jgi:hypothetical protein
MGQVHVPDDLLDAQRDGNLVIFAGAGVSIPPPSNFPDFTQLAERVASGVLTRRDGESIDRFLGRVQDRGIQVHRIVHEILSDRTSTPNRLHFDLLKLFGSGSSARLVTTNFDLHFSTAARGLFGEREVEIEVFDAPALPQGDSFCGIVYLHGSVGKPPDRMVLTDADFGRAYLTAGWARRFLQALFAHFTVLFVGYSYEDIVMQYLARGLAPNPKQKRYVLAPDEGKEKWELLGVIPLAYPLGHADDKHSALPEALSAWADLAGSGVLDKEERIKGIVQLPPPDGPVADYIDHALKDLPTTRFFTRHAKSPEWLRWVEKKGLLARLFRPGIELNPIEFELAKWFVDAFLFEQSNEALALVQRQGQTFNEVLQHLIQYGLFLELRGQKRTKIGAKWLAILLSNPTVLGRSDLLEDVLEDLHFPADIESAVFLFEFLTAPHVKLSEGFWRGDIADDSEEKVRSEIYVLGSHYHLNHAWERLIKPNLAAFADALNPIVTNHLLKAHRLLQTLGAAGEVWDPVSYTRSAIEPHGQDHLQHALDPTINAARDILEWYLESRPSEAQVITEQWARSSVPLLRRLAVHGVNHTKTLSSDEKIAWILNKDFLYLFGLKHELFLLLKNAYPGASEPTRAALLHKVVAGPPTPQQKERGEIREYETFNLLYWLHACDPTCKLAREEFEAIQIRHPEYGRREHPDMNGWIGPVRWGHESPITVDELIGKEPSEVLDWLLTFKETGPFGPERDGLLETIRGCTSRSFDWAWKLVSALDDRREWESDLWGSIVAGWQSRSLSEEEWGIVLPFLIRRTELLEAHGREIVSFLEHGVEKDPGRIPQSCITQCQKLSETLWEVFDEVVPKDAIQSDDWVMKAINHPGGQLVTIWLRNLVNIGKPTAQGQEEAASNLKRLFEDVISGDSHCAQLGRVVLASHIHVLYWMDPEWALSRVFGLLDWTKDLTRAEQAWHGYLTWGRWSNPTLPFLLPLYEGTYAHVGRELAGHRDRFCEHMAEIAVYGNVNPITHGWLKRFLGAAGSEERLKWASRLGFVLRNADEERKNTVWNDWLNDYWRERIRGVPLPLESAEVGMMVEWSTSLQPVFPQVVDRICESPNPTFQWAHLYHDLRKSNLTSQHPDSMARLLLHLLPGANPTYYDMGELAAIVEELAGSGGPAGALSQVCDELGRLGYEGARDLRDRIQTV